MVERKVGKKRRQTGVDGSRCEEKTQKKQRKNEGERKKERPRGEANMPRNLEDFEWERHGRYTDRGEGRSKRNDSPGS